MISEYSDNWNRSATFLPAGIGLGWKVRLANEKQCSQKRTPQRHVRKCQFVPVGADWPTSKRFGPTAVALLSDEEFTGVMKNWL
jgi:hypothetical protein